MARELGKHHHTRLKYTKIRTQSEGDSDWKTKRNQNGCVLRLGIYKYLSIIIYKPFWMHHNISWSFKTNESTISLSWLNTFCLDSIGLVFGLDTFSMKAAQRVRGPNGQVRIVQGQCHMCRVLFWPFFVRESPAFFRVRDECLRMRSSRSSSNSAHQPPPIPQFAGYLPFAH